jgi:precorrin-2 dehydrogenase / sirohydrochlorin ferrochelatase
MIPLFLDLTGRRVVIFGGGNVAARKAVFFSVDADVLIVSRSFSKTIAALPVSRRELDVALASDTELERLLHGAFIGVAALSDREQNNRIGRICRLKGIVFNNANGERGDLIIPSASRGKHYTIAVSTDGESPAVSRFVREQIEKTFSNLDEMIVFLSILRERLKAMEPSQKRRSEILWNVIHDPGVWDALGRSLKEAHEIVNRRYLHG